MSSTNTALLVVINMFFGISYVFVGNSGIDKVHQLSAGIAQFCHCGHYELTSELLRHLKNFFRLIP